MWHNSVVFRYKQSKKVLMTCDIKSGDYSGISWRIIWDGSVFLFIIFPVYLPYQISCSV